jgi:putative transposase
VRYSFISDNSSQFPTRMMCGVLRVSASGYYHWRNRPASARAIRHDLILAQIRRVHASKDEIYGYRRVCGQLLADGVKCSESLVCYLMRKNGLKAKKKRRFVVTTDSKHCLPISPNLLERNFEVTGPNQCWVGDITYIATDEGWLYLATVIDLYNRGVVGWSMSERINKRLVIDAQKAAICARRPGLGLIMHSDRGSQYASRKFRQLLEANGIISSMSRKGDPWDNAVAESFFKSLKTERTYWRHYRTREEARRDIFQYIEIFYNRQRLHSKLGYQPPMQFELAALAA